MQTFKSNAEPDVVPEPRDPDADFNKLRESDEVSNGNDTFDASEDAASTISAPRSQPASARKTVTATKKVAARASLPMKFKVSAKVSKI